MKKLTQSDLMQHSEYTFSNYVNRIVNDEFTLDHVEDILPGWLHRNNGHTIALNYVGQKGLKLLEKSNLEIQQEGIAYLQSVIDEYSQVIIALKLPRFFLNNDLHDTISFFQRIRYSPAHEFKLYYTTSKILDNENLISLTVPVKSFHKIDASMNELVCQHSQVVQNFQRYKILGNREKEIFKLLALGNNYLTIGEAIHISPATVKKHKQNIYTKLRIRKISELVKIAINLGVTEW